jgi:hypothetical protein
MKRFGFAQFRFVIAGILLLAAGLKAYQLATAPLPPVVQSSVFTPLLELLNDRYFQMMVVVGEILFALVLIAGLWRSWTWLLSLLGFSVFTLVSLMKGLSGESSCGCFGTVTVNPWITATFDALMVGLLLVFRERIDWSFPPLDRKKVLAVLLIWLVLAIPTMYAMLSLKQRPHAVLGTEFIGVDGSVTFMLEPERWIGNEFPFWDRIDSQTLPIKQGEWLILIGRKQCEECHQLLERLVSQKHIPVALLELSEGVQSLEEHTSDSAVSFHAILTLEPNWILLTPSLIRCYNGVCTAVGEHSIFSSDQ